MLWLERFIASRRLRVAIRADEVSVAWDTDMFVIQKEQVGEFCEWLLKQPDDEPIAIQLVTSAKEPVMALMERGYVRPFQKKLQRLAIAIGRRYVRKQ